MHYSDLNTKYRKLRGKTIRTCKRRNYEIITIDFTEGKFTCSFTYLRSNLDSNFVIKYNTTHNIIRFLSLKYVVKVDNRTTI